MQNKIKPIVSLILALGLFACQSPLIEHRNAEDQTKSPIQTKSPCPLDFTAHGLCAELVWDAQPNTQDEAKFTLRFWNATQSTEGGPTLDWEGEVAVKLWMPSMGHGSSPVLVTHATDTGGANLPGVYLASEIYFIMPGDWQVQVELKQDKQVVQMAEVSLHVE